MSSSQVRKQLYRTLEAQSLNSRSFSTKFADELTARTSSPFFLYLNVAFFVFWIVVNTGLVPGVVPFDPYPFGFLTMVVSLEAIFLSIFVLVSQNRAAQIATLREELHLRINLIAEREITKSLQVLKKIMKKMDIQMDDPEFEQMTQELSPTEIQRSIEEQLKRADRSLVKEVFRDINGLVKLTHFPNGNDEKK
jgi:uncharacterized membrane protein